MCHVVCTHCTCSEETKHAAVALLVRRSRNIGNIYIDLVNIHEDGKVSEMITVAHSHGVVALLFTPSTATV